MSDRDPAMSETFTLANKKHLEAFIACLVHMGAMCPKCGFGTRATSRRWAESDASAANCQSDRTWEMAMSANKPRRDRP